MNPASSDPTNAARSLPPQLLSGQASRRSRSPGEPEAPAPWVLEGDRATAFSPQPGRCFGMVQSKQLQATHCYEPPAWKGQWRDAKGRNW